MELEAFLADAVLATGGKLSALGMGWDVLATPGFPARHDRIAIGVLVRVPAEDTRRPHDLSVRLVDGGGAELPLGRRPDGAELRQLEAPFRVNPSQEGSTATFALNFDGLVFQEPGEYGFVLQLDGEECKRLTFRVQPPPGPPTAEVRAGGYLSRRRLQAQTVGSAPGSMMTFAA